MLEKFLTVSEGEFKKLLRSGPAVEEDSDSRREAYRYAMVGDILVAYLSYSEIVLSRFNVVRPIRHALPA
jgi:hypothetical protein